VHAVRVVLLLLRLDRAAVRRRHVRRRRRRRQVVLAAVGAVLLLLVMGSGSSSSGRSGRAIPAWRRVCAVSGRPPGLRGVSRGLLAVAVSWRRLHAIIRVDVCDPIEVFVVIAALGSVSPPLESNSSCANSQVYLNTINQQLVTITGHV
jgi:hypothetical protein